MVRSLNRLFHIGAAARRATTETAAVHAILHYKNEPGLEQIDEFKIGNGVSFLLTFVGGGTVAIDLPDVREIRFVGLADCVDGSGASTPVHLVKVHMSNGRVLEGFSADLHTFSGRKSGHVWNCTFRPDVSGFAAGIRQFSRIVIPESHHVRLP